MISRAVAVMAWASVFALSWLVIGERVPATALTSGLWGFFVLVALVAGIVSGSGPR